MNIADGEIGITTDFESVIPGSSPGPRTEGLDRVAGKVFPGPTNSMTPSCPNGRERETRGQPSTYLSNLVPAPCRLCHGPSYLTDELGAIHPCCQLNWDGRRCIACDSSEPLNREHRRRGKQRGWREVKAEGLDGEN